MEQKKAGKSESIYFNHQEVEQIAEEARAFDITPKELIKAKSLAKDGTVQVMHRVNFGHEMNQAMIDVGIGLRELSYFFSSLDSANDELLVHKDIEKMCEHFELTIQVFHSSIQEMKSKYMSN
ncbi:hypothetical protein [Mariprofundus ferrooxydans]|uniref:hypothetical protein n=1 Tax=Mariprofundus ferrooxydans TaxID=314344 RepID=UPI0006A6B028|nr:hypothetical protein [Mariprofundus ferrooxydans]KON48518.1 hypothetical protein AL013_02505 [Mariprofundus ferrooxydans]